MEQIEPIDIIMVTYNRLHLLKRAVKEIYKRTKYPHRLWVVDNLSTDGSRRWLKTAKAQGYIYEHIFNTENKGLASGLTSGFKYIESRKGGISEYVVTCHDDNIPGLYEPCWLERLLHLFKKYEPDYGAMSLRCDRVRRRDIDENNELIDSPTSLATFFRIVRSDDIQKLGYYFTNRPRWESPEIAKSMKKLKKKLAIATHIYCTDTGYAPMNKGFADGTTEHLTHVPERVNQGELQPFPEIDEKTCIPMNINTERDRDEQKKRDAYYDYWGRDGNKRHRTLEQKELAEYCKEGNLNLDLGCGMVKCCKNVLGVDIYPHPCVYILHDVRDLWMYDNESVDTIVNAHTLEHMPDAIKTLKEWKRVLKVGGILGIAVPDFFKKPKYMLKQGHKFPVSLEILEIIFKHILKMRIIRAEHVKGKKEGQYVALVVGKKR